MSYETPTLPWSEEQWASIQQHVQDSARRARVASSFLPVHGGVAPGQATVPALEMDDAAPVGAPQNRGETGIRLSIDSGVVRRFVSLSTYVYLTTVQAEDPELAAARDLLGRAGDVIARLEDAVIFNGVTAGDPAVVGGPVVEPQVHVARSNDTLPGLVGGAAMTRVLIENPTNATFDGAPLVNSFVEAIQNLESRGHYGPFACVLGQSLYLAAHTPNTGSMVLPADRITPFLGGPLLRSSTIPNDRGVIVSLSGSAVDLVFASDIHVRFVQVNLEPRYVLRVSERFVLRIKQTGATETLRYEEQGAPAPGAGLSPEAQRALEAFEALLGGRSPTNEGE
jgi:uncharacterized linocin/CFP29 family protein